MKKSEIKVGGKYLLRNGDGTTTNVEVVEVQSSPTLYVLRTCEEGKRHRKVKIDNGKMLAPIPGPKEVQKALPIMGASKLTTVKEPKPSKLVERLKRKPVDNHSHLIIIARAGTGKTTTLVEGLRYMTGGKSALTPLPQQAEVWKALTPNFSKGEQAPFPVCFVAFSRAIADELRRRVPPGVDTYTLHGLGNRVIRRQFPNIQLDRDRTGHILADLMERDYYDLKDEQPVLVSAVDDLVRLCKLNLANADYRPELYDLVDRYGIELQGIADRVISMVPAIMNRCRAVSKDNRMDYADMIWLPVELDLPMAPYQVLLVDEAQDLSMCQQRLAMKAGKRLVLCGDPKQAIFGFAGADSDSMPRMEELLRGTDRGVSILPLSVTMRCGKAIVKEARKYVPEFEAHENNCEGAVRTVPYEEAVEKGGKASYRTLVKDGDMVLCRTNAPLVVEALRFLKAGRKACIIGRNGDGQDIGQYLVKTIKRQKCCKRRELSKVSTAELSADLEFWYTNEVDKENAKRNPNEMKLANINDRYECITYFMEDMPDVASVVDRIETLFTSAEDAVGIRLSSMHKAKGLESDRVFILRMSRCPCPHPMAKGSWAKEQEHNLLYVAITRAKKELTYVVDAKR